MDFDDGLGVRVPIQPGLNIYVLGNYAKLQVAYTCGFWTTLDTCHSHLGVLQAQFTI